VRQGVQEAEENSSSLREVILYISDINFAGVCVHMLILKMYEDT